ncbi:MAG TPA: catalase family protein [Sunxiuqinia sp.]|nr:catalase family protein [Sunxiuqinia sp.]
MAKRFHKLLLGFIYFIRRQNPVYRDTFDKLFRKPISAVTQFLINIWRKNDHLGIAEEKLLPNEKEVTREIVEQMTAFLVKHYQHSIAERAGNTKTYGLVKAQFEILPLHEERLKKGIFKEPATYPAWVRFAGPGPLVTPDIKNNGILSIGVKLMGVDGKKLIDDEKMTQDFLGISAPTFTTPNIVENLKLQKQIYKGTPLFYFLNPFDSHYLDAVMQGLYAKTYASPLDLRYNSCAAYLFGDGQAIQYSLRPTPHEKSKVPKKPSDNYLREAMVKTLGQDEICFDFLIQFQTDAHKMPIENASVVWPEKLSPFIKVATLRIPAQEFDSPEQLAFARNLSFNPWHCIAEHRPLGNQNRARKTIYYETSKIRQNMNREKRIEPNTEGFFSGSNKALNLNMQN